MVTAISNLMVGGHSLGISSLARPTSLGANHPFANLMNKMMTPAFTPNNGFQMGVTHQMEQTIQDYLKNPVRSRIQSVKQPNVQVDQQPKMTSLRDTTLSAHISPELISAIEDASSKYGVPKSLIESVIKAESNFNPQAVSRAGALGLMQLMPATAKDLGVTNPMDIRQNVDGGAKYLRNMLDKFGQNVDLALAAYNAGPGAVQRYNGVPPYEETQNYVQKITKDYFAKTGKST